ncbi:MAG: FtsX-like permease family protein, partial [candidate division NC10 bacterium]
VGYDTDGFYSEAHPKLRPVETAAAGVFLAGACQAPKDIPDTVAQASAAAAKVLGLFAAPELSREPIVARVDRNLCVHCRACISTCPYGAIEDFEIKDSREEIEGQLKETAKYTLAATVLGAVAILAGGIGILNVTLAALFARIKEIGIRRAVGATRLDILSQFVAEAVLLGLCGGLAGLALGAGGIAYLARHTDRDLASLTWYHFAGALLIAGATGFFFSLYPAWKAATLDPVEALRNE